MKRQGAALIVVLFVVMTVAILSVGFLSRSDVELACGRNMVLRTQMDCLAESGLEHAKGLILNPHDVESEYWTGAKGQQLVVGSDFFYDVNVVKLGECNYQITCEAYRKKDSARVGRSSLIAELRLDPCIAYWTGDANATTIWAGVTINGDVYCGGSLVNESSIDGDVFAEGTITGGNITGQSNENVPFRPVNWPSLLTSTYMYGRYYIGTEQYSSEAITALTLENVTLGPTEGNPAGVYYREGNLILGGSVSITGTLVVNGQLDITGPGNTITPIKNFPAIIVGDHVEIRGNSASITVEGLVQIENGVVIDGTTKKVLVYILGALFTRNRGITVENPNFGSMTITAAPAKAAVESWRTAGVALRTTPAAGAFFKSIQRKFD